MFLDINSNAYISQSNSLLTQSGSSSLPSRLSSYSQHTKRQSELTSSFRSGLSSNSGNSSVISTRLSKLAVPLNSLNAIEGQLKIKYSGADGLIAGYCRVSSVFITIEILPSIQITNWDVLPAETYVLLNISKQKKNILYSDWTTLFSEHHNFILFWMLLTIQIMKWNYIIQKVNVSIWKEENRVEFLFL